MANEESRQLVCVCGGQKGGAWKIGERPLVFGRSVDCDVRLTDPVISRTHCRIHADDGKALFEDLGSRNPALINGAIVRKTELKVGDEIALGRSRFLLTADNVGCDPIDAPPRDKTATDSGPAVARDDSHDSSSDSSHPRPRTVHDLALLYEAIREFSRVESMKDLIERTRRQLQERFSPLRMWMARVHTNGDLTFYDHQPRQPGVVADPPLDTIDRCLKNPRGILRLRNEMRDGQEVRVSVLAMPVNVGGMVIAVLVLATETPAGHYTEDDLKSLSLLAQPLAPFVQSVEQVEQLRSDVERLRAQAGESVELVGVSRAICRVRGQLSRAAKSELNALIIGETGTGKELVARRLHNESARATFPLVIVNCAAIPANLFESELFGYVEGAFTGATHDRDGYMMQAHGGTLFLDEIGDLTVENQARILRAIEYKTFRRIGAEEDSQVDVRIVAATNRDIAADVDSGHFRADLYHRLNGFEICIPPLRQRPSDIPVLARHFFDLFKGQAKRPLTGIADDAIEYLCKRPWPGNVRQLRNCIQRATVVARQAVISLDHVAGAPDELGQQHQPLMSLAEMERRHILAVMERLDGNVTEAAKSLGIGRSTLYKKLAESKYGE